MGVKAEVSESEGFVPVKLEIDIETAEQFEYLWNVFNCPGAAQVEMVHTYGPRRFVSDGGTPLCVTADKFGLSIFTALNNLAKKEGWKN